MNDIKRLRDLQALRSKRLTPEYREHERQYSKKYRARPETKLKRVVNQVRYERKLKFGITDEDYQRMLAEQDGRCAICLTDKPGGRGDWHIDHNHDTGKTRSLLCCRCNLGLGFFKDQPINLLNAFEYLHKHNQKETKSL